MRGENYSPGSGKILRDDGTVVWLADILQEMQAKLEIIATRGIDHTVEVALGNVPGRRKQDVTGNSVVGTSLELISPVMPQLGENIPYMQSTGSAVIISSTSNDDDIAGIGLRTLDVHYLNNDYEECLETVEMNGQAGQTTVADDILRIQNLVCKTFGSAFDGDGFKFPQGTIWAGTGTLTDGIPANKIRGIATTETSSKEMLYTVPANKKYALSDIIASVATGKEVEWGLRIRAFGDSHWYKTIGMHLYRSYTNVKVRFPYVIAPKSDVMLVGVAAQEAAIATGFSGILVDI